MNTSKQQGELIPRSKSFRGQKLTKFPNISKWQNCEFLQFDDNPIENFNGLITLPNVKDFSLNNTHISSFLNVPELPKLERISLKMTPLGSYKTIDLMCALVFGNQLMYVNGEEITKKQKKFATQNRNYLLPYFREGWVLTSINPVRFIHYQTRARITIKIPTNFQGFENQPENSNKSNSSPHRSISQTSPIREIDNLSNESGYSIYEEDGQDNSLNYEDQVAMNTLHNISYDMTMKPHEETYVDQIRKKQVNKTVSPTTMRQIVRKQNIPLTVNYHVGSPRKTLLQQSATNRVEQSALCPSP